jgi:hypothetical protein
MLGIIENKVRNYFINQHQKLIIRLVVLHPDFVLLPNIARQIAHILVSPLCEVTIGALEQIIKTGSCTLLSENHRQNRQKVCVFSLK